MTINDVATALFPVDTTAAPWAERFAGEVFLPADAAYDQARRILDAAVDQYPAAVVRPANAGEVICAVNLARERGLELAIRSGGHSPAGFSTGDGCLVIDFSAMRAIELDPEAGTVRIEPGATWGEVAVALHPHGLAISSGDFGSVGVGGLTIGGGIGWMVRQVGLTVDHLLAADVVLADGTMVRASAEEHPDLFWAIRGGGNFGVVTSFTFRPHPAGMVTGGQASVLEVYNAGFRGPPLHIHHRHGEMYYVLEGEYLLQFEDEITTVPAGSFAYAAPGVRHTFASAGTVPGRLLIIGVPGGLETYVREVDRLLAAGANEDATRRLGEEWGTELVGPPLSPR